MPSGFSAANAGASLVLGLVQFYASTRREINTRRAAFSVDYNSVQSRAGRGERINSAASYQLDHAPLDEGNPLHL